MNSPKRAVRASSQRAPGDPGAARRSPAPERGDPPADALAALVARAEGVLARVEALLPPPAPDPYWRTVTAARWRKRGGRGFLQPVAHPHAVDLDALVAIDAQKETVERNTRQFVAGLQ